MNQEEIDRATKIAKTGVSQLDVDLVQAGYAQALKDVGEWLERNRPVFSSNNYAFIEALKQGKMPR